MEEKARIEGTMASLGSLLVSLTDAVFGWDTSTTARTVSVVWEDSERMAFNKGGLLFFNALYYEALGHAASYSDAVHFWFVTFCHEVAHNVSADHDRVHENAEEVLITEFLHPLQAFLWRT
mmetsp:Transcript_50961/g.102206  ORF Transcript_50961/g.102206 Transcript_50961/m.102206 type:complete len:121 (+) Transcript_50961:328-690(+)